MCSDERNGEPSTRRPAARAGPGWCHDPYREFSATCVVAARTAARPSPLPPTIVPEERVETATPSPLTPSSTQRSDSVLSLPQPVHPATPFASQSPAESTHASRRTSWEQPGGAAAAAPGTPAQPQPRNARRGGNAAPPAITHTKLMGQLAFLPYPSEADLAPLTAELAHRDAPPTLHSLFFGQCLFEMTAVHLQWLVMALTGGACRPTHIRPRGPGCFTVYFSSGAEVAQAMTLHERLLCDHTGLWIARDPREKDILMQHVAQRQTKKRGPPQRLPRDAVVIRL